jgi:hypothetical protein
LILFLISMVLFTFFFTVSQCSLIIFFLLKKVTDSSNYQETVYCH